MFIKSSYKLGGMESDSLYGLRLGDILYTKFEKSANAGFEIARVVDGYSDSVRVEMFRGSGGPDFEHAHQSQASRIVTSRAILETFRKEIYRERDLEGFKFFSGGSCFLEELEVVAYLDHELAQNETGIGAILAAERDKVRIPDGQELLDALREARETNFHQSRNDGKTYRMLAAAVRLEEAVKLDLKRNAHRD